MSDAAATTALGGPRIYDDVPARAEFPFMTLGQSAEHDWSTGTDEDYEHVISCTSGRAPVAAKKHRLSSRLRVMRYTTSVFLSKAIASSICATSFPKHAATPMVRHFTAFLAFVRWPSRSDVTLHDHSSFHAIEQRTPSRTTPIQQEGNGLLPVSWY
ncbi:DUF3168 domain-containing protein [Hyphomicrobium sp.]|uniref:tail completion protein gp17 n=1 Tax=Hyphomicrobium sp. TaxID=82 RepID=UPI0025B99FE8|nr:DUF3168 domain-containing protein [Hyphomicrobium sp.]